MKNKKLIIYGLLVFIIGILLGAFIISLSNKGNANNTAVSNDEHEKIVSGYSFETTDKNVINKELKDGYLNSFVTVAAKQDEFYVNLKGIDSNSEVFLINPNTGDMTPIQYNNGKFSTKVNLDKDITYGIIMDYKLVGSIRVVEDLKAIDQDQLFSDILISMGCGL